MVKDSKLGYVQLGVGDIQIFSFPDDKDMLNTFLKTQKIKLMWDHHYGELKSVSPSSLMDYISCPYKFYVKRTKRVVVPFIQNAITIYGKKIQRAFELYVNHPEFNTNDPKKLLMWKPSECDSINVSNLYNLIQAELPVEPSMQDEFSEPGVEEHLSLALDFFNRFKTNPDLDVASEVDLTRIFIIRSLSKPSFAWRVRLSGKADFVISTIDNGVKTPYAIIDGKASSLRRIPYRFIKTQDRQPFVSSTTLSEKDFTTSPSPLQLLCYALCMTPVPQSCGFYYWRTGQFEGWEDFHHLYSRFVDIMGNIYKANFAPDHTHTARWCNNCGDFEKKCPYRGGLVCP